MNEWRSLTRAPGQTTQEGNCPCSPEAYALRQQSKELRVAPHLIHVRAAGTSGHSLRRARGGARPRCVCNGDSGPSALASASPKVSTSLGFSSLGFGRGE